MIGPWIQLKRVAPIDSPSKQVLARPLRSWTLRIRDKMPENIVGNNSFGMALKHKH